MIDNGQDSDRISIKDLTLREGTKMPEAFFDARRDITPEQWNFITLTSKKALDILTSMSSSEANDNGHGFVHEYLRGIAIVAPEKISHLMDGKAWDTLKSQMDAWDPDIYDYAIGSYMKKATFMKLLAPDGVSREDIINDDQWEKINSYFQKQLGQDNEYDQIYAIEIAAEVRLLAPEKAKEFQIADLGWKYIAESMKLHKGNLGLSEDYVRLLSNILNTAKILDPKRLKTLEISETTWDEIGKFNKSNVNYWLRIDEQRKDDINFSAFAGSQIVQAGILSAGEIQISDSGVKLVNVKQGEFESSESPTVPVGRKF